MDAFDEVASQPSARNSSSSGGPSSASITSAIVSGASPSSGGGDILGVGTFDGGVRGDCSFDVAPSTSRWLDIVRILLEKTLLHISEERMPKFIRLRMSIAREKHINKTTDKVDKSSATASACSLGADDRRLYRILNLKARPVGHIRRTVARPRQIDIGPNRISRRRNVTRSA